VFITYTITIDSFKPNVLQDIMQQCQTNLLLH